MDIVYTINCSYSGFLAEEKKYMIGIVGNVLCQMDNVVIVKEGISEIYTLSCCLAVNRGCVQLLWGWFGEIWRLNEGYRGAIYMFLSMFMVWWMKQWTRVVLVHTGALFNYWCNKASRQMLSCFSVKTLEN